MRPVEDSIVRLLRVIDRSGDIPRKVIVGAGFLVGDKRHILTCAHVLKKCLPEGEQSQSLPGRRVAVDFPLLAVPSDLLYATVDFVKPGEAGDIAGLTLADDPPPGAAPATLVYDENLERHQFKAFGVPMKSEFGEFAYGKITGTRGPWIQIEAESQVGRRVKRGYSGTAVYDLDLHGVAGMVVQADEAGTDRVALMIPAKTLVDAWSTVLKGKAIAACPYRGINPFEEGDVDVFFGRESLTAQLMMRVQENSFIAVVAPSGSGKSSLLRAGLMPRARAEGWHAILVRGMGKDPFKSLAAALLSDVEPAESTYSESVRRLAAAMLANGLADDVTHALELSGKRQLLLILDQLEELFTLCHDEEVIRKFADGIVELANLNKRGRSPVTVLCALRADYAPHMTRYPALASHIRATCFNVPALGRSELTQAIEEPAALAGVSFEKGLVERITEDVLGQPSALPHLQYVLTLLWHEQDRHWLTNASYERLGGVKRGLAQQADATYERLSETDQAAARRVFVQLVHLRRETKGTQRPIVEKDLLHGDWDVLEKLADAMLVTTGCTAEGERCAQLSHEALVEAWPRLAEWVDSTAENVWRLDHQAELLIRRHVAATVAAAAVPWADIALVPGVFANMAQRMGRVYGIDVDREAAKNISSSVIAGVAVVGATWLTVFNMFKTTGIGYAASWVIEAPLLVPMTYAIGHAWQFYFRVRYIGGGTPTAEQMREIAVAELKIRVRNLNPRIRKSRRMRDRVPAKRRLRS